MGTPWDRAARAYLDTWVPRFMPYHNDLVREAALLEGDRVFVSNAGPGTEVVAAARSVGATGHVRAIDKSHEMVTICRENVARAGLGAVANVEDGDAEDTSGGPWDAVVCAFGLWQMPERVRVLGTWARSLRENGKVIVATWGPSEASNPIELLRSSLHELEPLVHDPDPNIPAAREAMSGMFEAAGLVMVRHTVVRHTITFATAEEFVRAMTHGCILRRSFEELGDERMSKVAAHFFAKVGGPETPLSFDPPATIAVACPPGAEVKLEHRPSVRVPAAPKV
ncbi:MAG: methyltransferase domain-containing protein [Polyangiaceae bacterium]